MGIMALTCVANAFTSIVTLPVSFVAGHAADAPDLDASKKSTEVGFLPREQILAIRVDGGEAEKDLSFPIHALENAQHPTVVANYSVTSKGNGSIQIGDTNIRIYDLHKDGRVFEGGLLHDELVDIGDGVPEIMFYGIVDESDEKDEQIVKRIPVLSIWKLKPDGAGLIEVVHDDLVYSWVIQQ